MPVGSAEIIEAMLDRTEKRDTIAIGMWNRYKLEPATKYDWNDPRKADGVPILSRRAFHDGTINQRLHTPFDRTIVNNKVAYFASNIQVTFGEGVPQTTKDFYKGLDEKATFKAFQLGQAKHCVDQGTSYFLCWIDDKKQFRVSESKPQNTFIMYDELSGEPILGFRYDLKRCFIYDGMEVTKWEDKDGTWIPQTTKKHGMGTKSRPMVPIVELRNNPECMGNPEMVVSLSDAHDTTMSDLSSEIAQMRLAYLLAKGLGSDADKIKKELQQAGVIIIDSDGGDAKFITKDLNVDAVKLLKDTLRELIFEGSASYDPTAFVSGGTPPTAYQVSERLQPLEMDCEITIAEWKSGFRQLDYLIQTFLMMFKGVKEYDLQDIDRIFKRVAPRNTLQALVDAKNAGIVLSQETMQELSGLQIDPETEKTRLSNQAVNKPTESLVDEESSSEESGGPNARTE